MDTPGIYRQGDVLLIPCKAPRLARIRAKFHPVKRDRGRVVLAYGEVTGHAHAIEEKEAILTEAENARFLLLMRDVTLTHEEHAPIELPKGTYEVIHQQTFVGPERSAWEVLD